jgi:hypothetical protein
MERKSRAIRLDDQEWEGFKRLLGTVWLRRKIALALTKEQRKPTETPTKE